MSDKKRKAIEDQLHKSFRVQKNKNTTQYSVCIIFRQCEFEDKQDAPSPNQNTIKQDLVKLLMEGIEDAILSDEMLLVRKHLPFFKATLKEKGILFNYG